MSKVYTIGSKLYDLSKVKLINELYPKQGTLLDIGCGTGNFFQAAKNDGWKISGTEPDSEARNTGAKRVGEPYLRPYMTQNLLTSIMI